MTKKIVVIEYCDSCPNFDDTYYDYCEYCLLLERKILDQKSMGHCIPDDCPLKDYKEE